MNIRIAGLVLAFALTASLSGVVPQRALAAASEYELKAAFLVNFAKFVEWPAAAFDTSASPVLVGVVGDDPFGPDLDNTVRGKLFGGRSMDVKRFDWRDDLTGFHIVFISASEQRRLKDILRPLETTSILTVSDMDDFCTQGGVIALVSVKERIRFEVNRAAARRRGLKISSRLLSLATAVH